MRKARSGWGGLITVRRAYSRSAAVRRRGGEVCRGFEGSKEGVGGYGFQVNGLYGMFKGSEGRGSIKIYIYIYNFLVKLY